MSRKAILLIDHGSRRAQAHEQLLEIASRLESRLKGIESAIVEIAHMEIAEPSIAKGVHTCVSRGATEIVAVPCLLSRGRHVAEDIPRLLHEAASTHTQLKVGLSGPLSEHEGFIDLLMAAATTVNLKD